MSSLPDLRTVLQGLKNPTERAIAIAALDDFIEESQQEIDYWKDAANDRFSEHDLYNLHSGHEETIRLGTYKRLHGSHEKRRNKRADGGSADTPGFLGDGANAEAYESVSAIDGTKSVLKLIPLSGKSSESLMAKLKLARKEARIHREASQLAPEQVVTFNTAYELDQIAPLPTAIPNEVVAENPKANEVHLGAKLPVIKEGVTSNDNDKNGMASPKGSESSLGPSTSPGFQENVSAYKAPTTPKGQVAGSPSNASGSPGSQTFSGQGYKMMLVVNMEYCKHGELLDYLDNMAEKAKTLYDNGDVAAIDLYFGNGLRLLLQVVTGLKKLLEHGIQHRDIQAKNIFITECAGVVTAKIGDFGMARKNKKKESSGDNDDLEIDDDDDDDDIVENEMGFGLRDLRGLASILFEIFNELEGSTDYDTWDGKYEHGDLEGWNKWIERKPWCWDSWIERKPFNDLAKLTLVAKSATDLSTELKTFKEGVVAALEELDMANLQ